MDGTFFNDDKKTPFANKHFLGRVMICILHGMFMAIIRAQTALGTDYRGIEVLLLVRQV